MHNRHIIHGQMAFIQKSNSLISLATPSALPANWTVLLDAIIPPFVKSRFSPKESWKNKPFSKDDILFFSRGLTELSEFFTVDREGARLAAYFTNERFRSSYFLYFFALQGAKFLSLFEKFPLALQAAIDHGTKTGTLKVIDVGSGPGTASFALLAHILNRYEKSKKLPFKIHLHWIDRNKTILDDGELLLNEFLATLSEWDGDIKLTTEARDWWQHPKHFNPEASLIVFGNVLNESPKEKNIFQQGLIPFLKNPKGAGILFVEPAFKSASQRLSQIRDELVLDPDYTVQIWGPCLHLDKCPLADGRDWCHFSVPAKLPGKWFRQFSIKLGGVRDWLKFSFLWVAAPDAAPATTAIDSKQNWFRVVSDPIKTKQGKQNQVCAPDRISWITTPPKPYFRGDIALKLTPTTPEKNKLPYKKGPFKGKRK